MTSGGSNFNDFREDQLTKVRAVLRVGTIKTKLYFLTLK